jgi:TPR repeat protein
VHSGTKDDAMNFDVFISYPHQEKATADAVCATLEAAGIRCWIAPRDVPGGAEWADAIVDAIDHCKAMVLVFSSHTNGSKQILREVQRAFDREKPVLPVRIEKVAPESGLAYYMGPVHWLDAFTPPLQQHLQNLRRSVEAVVKSTASVPPEPGGGAPPKEFSDAVSSGNSAANVSAKTTAGRRNQSLWMLAITVCLAVLLGGAGFWIAVDRHWFSTEMASDHASVPGPKPDNPGPSASFMPGNLTAILAAANRGDSTAENALGIEYAQGLDGLPHDDTQAVEWYKKSAVQGNPRGETNLGDMYLYGRGGLTQSYVLAMSWYLKAAQQNWADAQFRLAVLYERGIGTEKNVAQAVQLYRSAANQGHAEAQNVLGALYAVGDDGVEQDYQQALAWFQKSAAQGYAKAEKNLGDMYFFGHAVDKDYAQAFSWYKKAADQGFADAQLRLGSMYEKGLGTPQSKQDAIDQYKKAAGSGSGGVDIQKALSRLGVFDIKE